MSCSIALRRSPNPGAFTAATFTIPRMVFTTSVASASPSTSSEITSNGLPDFATPSSTGRRSRMFDTFLSCRRMYGSSSSADIESWSLMKYGERYPRSNCMPSTTSSSFSRLLPSSTVITPSLPTFSIASAMISPIASSPFAEMAPTCAIAVVSFVGFDSPRSPSTVLTTALSMPRLRSIGFIPAATAFRPSRIIACASTVAVVVPSPATSEVFDATSFTI